MEASVGSCAAGVGAVSGLASAALQFFAAAQCLLSEPWPPHAQVANGSEFDFIIVGAGTAGSALAARLAQSYFDVLLVEAGGDPPEETIVPGFFTLVKNTPYDWNFTTVNDGYTSQGLAGRCQQQPRGKMLGGTGSINDMVYSRGHPTDYQQWASIIGDTWNWTNVLPYFMKSEYLTDERITNKPELAKWHGRHGEIEVSGRKDIDPANAMLLKALEELGFDIVDDMTNPYKIGAGRLSHTIRNGRRDSTTTALLNKVRSNNLHVLKNTLVTKVLIANNTAYGIMARTNDEEFEYFARNEVIISAGTFNTPKLLMLSGVGPRSHLEEFGIQVVRDLPVGENFHDHVFVTNYISIENGFCSQNESNSYFEIIKYLHDSTGTYSYSDSIAAYLPKAGEAKNVPHHAVYTSCIGVGLLSSEECLTRGYEEDICRTLLSTNEQNELISLSVTHLKPQSRGRVRLRSADPLDDPLIYANTFSNSKDLEGYPEAIQFMLSLANTTYLKGRGARVVDMVSENCKGQEDLALIECQAREFVTSAWHGVGTAAMGMVVDAKLRVLGVRGLRVVDASVMPVVIRGNTNAPVVMIAERAADFIKVSYNNSV